MIGLIILAGGRGSRLNAKRPKCLYKLAGKPIIDYVLKNFAYLKPQQKIIVVGYEKEKLIKHLGKNNYDFVEQKQLLGTAHAAKIALKKINKNIHHILITNSDDAAFYKPSTLKTFFKKHIETKSNFSLLTVKLKKIPRFRLFLNAILIICQKS